MKRLFGLSFAEIAFEVCSAFDRANVLAVLVGGGAATFYAPEAYQTRDLDFVLRMALFGMPNASILSGLGWTASNAAGTYEHPETEFTLEILQGPLAVGEEVLCTWDTHRRDDLVLHVITPIDSVKDRLPSAIHFKDLSAARQAAQIAKRHPIDLAKVESWCKIEGGSKIYAIFVSFLRA